MATVLVQLVLATRGLGDARLIWGLGGFGFLQNLKPRTLQLMI